VESASGGMNGSSERFGFYKIIFDLSSASMVRGKKEEKKERKEGKKKKEKGGGKIRPEGASEIARGRRPSFLSTIH